MKTIRLFCNDTKFNKLSAIIISSVIYKIKQNLVKFHAVTKPFKSKSGCKR